MTIDVWTTLAAATLLLVSCAATGGGRPASDRAATLARETVEPEVCRHTAKVSRVGDVYLASQPAADGFKEFRERGVGTVINFRLPAEEPSIDAAAAAQGLGMRYVNPAFGGADDMTDAVVDESRRVLNEAEGPVLVYCASANRVGAVWLAWRVLDGGKDYRFALDEAQRVGLRNPRLEAKAKDYILRHGGKAD